jgi:type I restriction enzyme, S subunit
MKADRLFDGFNLLGDEPETIQQFRKLVVGLAVSGKLTAQCEATSDASNLMKLIEEKKRELVQLGQLRKQSPAATVTSDDLPKVFLSPENFVRLGSIARIEKGLTGIMKAEPGPYPLVVTAEERSNCDHFDFEGAAAIVPLVSSAGHGKASLQRLHYQEGKFALGSILAAIFPYAPELISPRFLFEYLTAFKDELLVSQMIGTANVSLSIGKVSDVPVPLVPPSIQQKVDELMALCDRLEMARADREKVRDSLATASLARLNAPDTATFQDDARFALDTLTALTNRPDQIEGLRQTVLNLAIRGKLVPQDPNDEVASELLIDISKTRKKLYLEKKIPKPKQLPPVNEIELPFAVPSSWAWSMLGDLCFQVSDGPHFSPQYVAPEQGVPFLSTRNVRPNGFDLSTIKYVSRADHEEFCKRIRPEKGDIIYTKGGTTGIAKVNDLDFEFSVWVHLAVLRIEKKRLLPRYIEMALNSPHCYEQSQRYTQGISNFDLGLTRMIKITIPLPPLAEQHRIVAKVDELMALCDRLEASLEEARTTRRRFLDALLAEGLVQAESREMEAAE